MATKLVFDAPFVIDGQAVGGWSRVIGQSQTVHQTIHSADKVCVTAVTRAAEAYASTERASGMGSVGCELLVESLSFLRQLQKSAPAVEFVIE